MFNKNKIETLLKIKTGTTHENYFIELLKKHNAVIAGSFVLSQYVPSPSFKPYDIDIYVNEKQFDDFIVSLLEKGIFTSFYYLTTGLITSSTYDQSFLKKNGIKFKISGYLNLKEKFRTDIMIVRDDRNIKDIVSNFDLSICEIWYDGKDIQATHEDHILKKEGILRKEYHTTFFEGNKFIMNRIYKYKNRGFTIKLEKMDNYIISVPEKHKELKKENIEECLVKHVLEQLIVKYVDSISVYNHKNDHDSFKKELDSKFKNCAKLESQERTKCYLKELYLFCNRFNRYDITELYFNSRVFFGCKQQDVNKIVIQLKKHMNYNQNNLITKLKTEQNDTSNINRVKTLEQKIKNIDMLLDFINTLNLTIDNIQLFINNIDKKYKIIKKNNYVMNPIVLSEDINEINGFDIITLENSKVGEYLKKSKTNLVLINYNNNRINGDICLMNRDSLESYMLNLRDQWFYKCNEMNKAGSVVKSTPYIKLPTNSYNIYVYWYELFDMYFRNKKGQNVFIYKETDELINYSISHKNAFNENPNWVGANHCQDKSDFKVSKIYYVEKTTNRSINKSIISSLEKSLLQHLNEKTVNKINSKIKTLSLKSSSKSSNSKIKSI